MVPLQLAEETFICDAVFHPGLLTHLIAKCGDEVTRKILVDARFVLQPTGDLESYSLHKLCSAGGIVQLLLDKVVCPRPKLFRHRDHARVDSPALWIPSAAAGRRRMVGWRPLRVVLRLPHSEGSCAIDPVATRGRVALLTSHSL